MNGPRTPPAGWGDRLWDAAVVGAGPAGSMVALELARRGRAVLLLERQPFPRFKVCGACLNGGALGALSHVGLGGLATGAGAPRLGTLRLTGWGSEASVPLHGSRALSREALDQALAVAAVEAGAVWVEGASAELGCVDGDARILTVRRDALEHRVRARIVVSAAGLHGLRSGEAEGSVPAPIIPPHARVGVGAVFDDGAGEPGAASYGVGEQGAAPYGPGLIHMVVGPAGYVGLVRQEDHRLNVAAAFDLEWMRRHGSPDEAVRAHLDAAGMPPLPGVLHHDWKGTPPLTRRLPTLGDERMFFVGDAAGYVEPFTGEGMAWALWGALALAPLADAGVSDWSPMLTTRWEAAHRRRIGRSQRVCGVVAWSLRRSRVARVALGAIARAPVLARPFALHTSTAEYLQ